MINEVVVVEALVVEGEGMPPGPHLSMILRVGNPHPYWRQVKTLHEVRGEGAVRCEEKGPGGMTCLPVWCRLWGWRRQVNVMRYVRQHTSIPVPEVSVVQAGWLYVPTTDPSASCRMSAWAHKGGETTTTIPSACLPD